MIVPDRLALCYHAVSEEWPAAMSIPPAHLDAQLTALTERGYAGMTFSEMVTGPGPRQALAVTFDDGLLSVLEHALPILSRHGLVGTLFIPTGFIGRARPVDWPGLEQWIGGPHEHELTPLSWAEVESLAAAGWEIGSHTASHPKLTDVPDARLRAELTDSRRECEDRLGMPCRSIAFPYGAVDRRVMDAARRAGYLAAAALPERIHRRHRYRWPRVGIWRSDPAWVFDTKLSPVARRRLHFPTGAMRRLPQWRFSD
jgi:peptidoglycan/xylan/chitin deacetylase (PgdA/CDA1 family)